MRYYDYLMPSVNFFGPGCLEVIGKRAKILHGKKALIVTDQFLFFGGWSCKENDRLP